MRRQLLAVTFALATAGMMLGGIALRAQDRGSLGEPKTGNCNANLSFSSGTAPADFKICLSSEGNVVDFIRVNGVDHMLGYEGYTLCTPENGGTVYYDAGSGGQNGWNAATTISQPNGPKTFPVTITRTTADGKWRLEQKYSRDTTEKDLQITMALKRLLSPIGATVYLSRWSDFNINGTLDNDVGDRTNLAIWARGTTRATTLQALTSTYMKTAGIGPYPFGRENCTTPDAGALPIGPADLAGRVTYILNGFNTNQSKTVVFRWAAL